MNKEEQSQKLSDGFIEFAAEYPQNALILIIRLFVGMMEYSVAKIGGDENQEIKIDGVESRDITIHKTKETYL